MLTNTFLDLGAGPLPAAAPTVPIPAGEGVAMPAFALALAGLLSGAAPAALAMPVVAGRQTLAGPGKDVPQAAAAELVAGAISPAVIEGDASVLTPIPTGSPSADEAIGVTADTAPAGEEDGPTLDPALAWLMPPASPAASTPAAIALPTARVTSSLPQAPGEASLPVPSDTGAVPTGSRGSAEPAVPSGTGAVSTGSRSAAEPTVPPVAADPSAPISVDSRPAARTAVEPTALNARPEQPLRHAASAAPVPTPIGAAVASSAPSQLSPVRRAADLIGPAAFSQEAPTDPTAPVTSSASVAASTLAPTGHVIAAHGSEAARSGVDLTRDPGLHRMIDHIERLRDGADAMDNRIRLVPDALGPVDVTVKRERDGIQVHFAAAEPAARQLLAEAAPRLTELAEARGVRIDRTTVDHGGQHAAGDGQTRQQTAQSNMPRAPVRAATDSTPEPADDRIA